MRSGQTPPALPAGRGHRRGDGASPDSAEPLVVRRVTAGEAGILLALIRELAAYEQLAGQVQATEGDLAQALGGTPPRLDAWLAWRTGELAGCLTTYFAFSTFAGRRLLFVEDLYVRPAHRRAGVGRALLAQAAAHARASGCAALEWLVLDWNEPALAFYRRVGAARRSEWVLHRCPPERLLQAVQARRR